MKQKHILESNNKAFTLIEVLISISILVLVFTFLYSQFNLAQISTKKTTQVEQKTTKREQIKELFYNDFLKASALLVPTSGIKYDKLETFSSRNSLYGIIKPYIKYIIVSTNENNSLIRIESHNIENISLGESENEFYMDEIVKDIEYFKISTSNKEYIEFFIKAKDMKDIYFKFKRIIK